MRSKKDRNGEERKGQEKVGKGDKKCKERRGKIKKMRKEGKERG